MPLSTIPASVIAISAAAQRVAYRDYPGSAVQAFEALVGQTGWSGISGPVVGSDGYYTNGDAAAFAIMRAGTLVISFRGSEGGADFYQAAFDVGAQVRALSPFIESMISFVRSAANGVTQLIITGHSLGGELAEIFASVFGPRLFGGDDPGAPIPASSIYLVTFGSPGVPNNLRNIDSDGDGVQEASVAVSFPFGELGARAISFGHSEDPVFERVGPVLSNALAGFQRAPTDIVAQLLDPDGTFDGQNEGAVSGLSLSADEHSQALYYQTWTELSGAAWYSRWLAGDGGILALRSDDPFDKSPQNPNDAFLLNASQAGAAVLGLAGDDAITVPAGFVGTTFVAGGPGNDRLRGGGGADNLDGGSASDSISGGAGDDSLWGGGGVDYLEGGVGNDTLAGGLGGDFYSIGINQGIDTINDQGSADSSDVLRIFGGSTIVNLSQILVKPSGGDLIITATDSANLQVLSITILNASSAAGHIEQLQLFVGDADEPLTMALPGAGGAPPSGFADDFNRSDGAVGNGWLSAGAATVISGNALTVASPGLLAGIYRPIDFGAGLTVSATVTQMNGFGGFLLRYDTSFLVGSDGSASSGYGIALARGDSNYDSILNVVYNGAVVGSVTSPVPYGPQVDVSFSVLADFTINAAITSGGNTFTYSFTPQFAVALAGSNVAIMQGGPDNRGVPGNSLTYPTIDNVVIQGVVVDDFSPSSPTTNGVMTVGAPITGFIETPIDKDWFAVSLVAGTAYRFDLIGSDGAAGTLADPFMRVRNGAGASLTANNNAGPSTKDAGITFLAPATGTYFISVGGDLISGGTYALRSSVVGNAQSVVLQGGAGSDNLVGLASADVLHGNGGSDYLDGGDGDDLVDGGSGVDVLVGGQGNDTFVVGEAGDVVVELLNQGTDTVQTTLTNVSLASYANVENLTYLGAGAFIGQGDDGANVIEGGAGNDYIYAYGGDDTAFGNAGIDVFILAEGSDTARGGDGQDYFFGDLGDDTLYGEGGVDVFNGGDGADTMYGGDEGDFFYGDGGDDVAFGENGNDIFVMTAGNDTASGGAGQDYFYMGDGNDTLNGGDGVDVMLGEAGDDVFNPGLGVDYVFMGTGTDRLNVDKTASGVTVLQDFTPGAASGDVINLTGTGWTSFAQVQAAITDFSASGGFCILTLDADTSIWFIGVAPSQLTAGDFIFGGG